MKKIFSLTVYLLLFVFFGCKEPVSVVTISFDLNGGNIAGKTETIKICGKVGEKITLPDNPQREGYVFKGWSKNPPTIMPENDQYFTALWNILLTVSYQIEGNSEYSGETLPELQVEKGTILTIEQLPLLEDTASYIFSGWYDKDNQAVANVYKVENSITLKTKWLNLNYLVFSANDSQSLTIERTIDSLSIPESFQYSVDNGENWKTPILNTPIGFGKEVKLYLRGKSSTGTARDFEEYLYFSFETAALVECYGDIRTLVHYENPNEADTSEALFCGLFSDCTVLTKAPTLGSQTLKEYCYFGMFSGCSGLTQTPSLPAEKIERNVYKCMFEGCTNLVSALDLNAKELKWGCYSMMFKDCTSLQIAPNIKAVKLADECFYGMFEGCSKLKVLTMLATTDTVENPLKYWLRYTVDSTVYDGLRTLTVAKGMRENDIIKNNVPEGWTIMESTN